MHVEIDREVTVGSSNIELGQALIESARRGVLELASKYFGKITSGSVHFTREGMNYRCSINIQPGGLEMASAEAQAKDAHLSLDAALEKVGKQLRRMKRSQRDDKPVRPGKGAV
ncbi:MAG TPA: HPF/RaiA family ribosome-associated protein [Beijerinckiaceae bacterium]|nr:HPF/RaiA family ribosome-associated protein [Beijerinckiaceae bacterium]